MVELEGMVIEYFFCMSCLDMLNNNVHNMMWLSTSQIIDALRCAGVRHRLHTFTNNKCTHIKHGYYKTLIIRVRNLWKSNSCFVVLSISKSRLDRVYCSVAKHSEVSSLNSVHGTVLKYPSLMTVNIVRLFVNVLRFSFISYSDNLWLN